MSYLRVIPRDLFNESKLLKCLGQVCLHIHDNRAGRLAMVESGAADGEQFEIDQNEFDGSLYVSNLQFRLRGSETEI